MMVNGTRTLKVRILRSCFAGGVVRRVGEIVELPADEALELLSLSKAEPVNRLQVRSRERVRWEKVADDHQRGVARGWLSWD